VKKFGSFVALPHLDLDIADKEFLVLLGPSGCGKTTTMRMIAGLEEATAGEIFIGEDPVNDVLPKYRDVAMVFQSYALYPHLTVEENIGYPLKIRKIPTEERRRRVTDVARRVELDGLLARLPKELSGGQRQRVALARAIVRIPKVFLMDEPLSNLDAKLRGQMRVEIRTLQRRLKTTSVYVTHDQLEAMTLADRLVVMNAGRIEQVGAPTELYERPATLFVAGFIGSPPMNLLQLGALPEADAARLRQLAPGVTTIGIRPDALTLDATPGAVALGGTVALVEPVGAESHVHLRWQDKLLVAQLRGKLPFADGDSVTLHADPAAIHCFAEDGRRISAKG
jgi:ABC-type sugar transport system ATPase subunit